MFRYESVTRAHESWCLEEIFPMKDKTQRSTGAVATRRSTSVLSDCVQQYLTGLKDIILDIFNR